MPCPQAQGLGHTAQAGGAGDYRSQTNPSMPRKTACPYEEHVVTDPNVSRIVLMIMLDLMNRNALYDYAEDERTMFHCPIIRCYEEFDQPIGLIRHLLECKRLKFGDFNCLRCKDCHRYPVTERGWLAWEGWPAEAPAIPLKKRLSEFPSSIFRAVRTKRRSNAPSSHDGSPSAAVKGPGPPEWMWSGTGHPAPHDKMSLGPLPGQIKTKYVTAAPYELQGTSSRSIELPGTPLPCYRQSSSGSFMSGQNSSSRSGSSSQPAFDIWGSSTSSLGSSHVTAAELQIHTSPVRYFGNLTQSPDGIHLVQAGGQSAWGPTSTAGYADEAAPRTNAFVPTPDSQGIAADRFPIPAINGPLASHQIDNWNPRDDSQFSYLQKQMSPPPLPQELHPDFINLLRDTPAANSGALDPCLEISGQTAVCELSDQSVCELSGQSVAYELYGQYVAASELGCEGRPTCEICGLQPREAGKPENAANYLRRHKQIHLGRKFHCQNIGCGRSYSSPDNLSRHVKESHPGSLGTYLPNPQRQQATLHERLGEIGS